MDEPQNLTLPVDATSAPSAKVDELDRETAAQVEEFIVALLKELKARQAYVPGNPLIGRFHHAVCDQALRLWESVSHLTLRIDEGQLLWQSCPVYDHPVGHDNLAFMFFRDGLRTIALLPGCERGELREFLEILASIRQGRSADLLATLWHRDFSLIRFEYVDVSEDEALDLPVTDRTAGEGEEIPTGEIERVLEAGPLPPDVDESFNSLLLTEADRQYLQREIDLELHRPLAHDVTLALLDQFEMRDQERRRQVVDILRELLPRLLREPDFPTVSLIVNELQLLANRTGERDTQELVVSLLRDMSEAMAELVSASEAIDQAPQADELDALLGALQAEAMPTLVRALPAIADPVLRKQVEEALDRLTQQFPRHITMLLKAEDPMLAAEAAGIVARLGVPDALQSLIDAATRPEAIARKAAVRALGHCDPAAATSVVLAALGDDDAMVRVAAADALALIGGPPAAEAIRRAIDSRRFAGRDTAEQMAFLKALVDLSDVDSVQVLSDLLNGRRWLVFKHAPSLRASAARALGALGTTEAAEALKRAENDSATTVASAVRVSLRHVEQGPGPTPPVGGAE